MAKKSQKWHLVKAAQQYLETLRGASLALFFLCLSISVGPYHAVAQVYKVVDENGNVSFSDSPPKQGDAEEVLNLDITNSYDSESIRARQKQLLKDIDQQRTIRSETDEKYNAELQRLTEEVAKARSALEAAEQIKAGDYLATKNGTMRRSDAYVQRVAEAKALLEDAKAALATFKKAQ